jgi:UDP-3-O-[3-hydroxymyristoyl] glucosamine N-acyltransferase
VTICANARIGDNVTLYPGIFIGPSVELGDDVVLHPNVVIYDGCVLGNRVTVHAGTVIGEDGLGFAPVKEKWLKIPQAGAVIIEDDVELGANCTIDRATLGTTRVGAGTKFSNLVAIGHGCQIGPDCLFVAQVGVAGSVVVGRHVTLAGQAGVVGHLSIGDNASVCAQAGVSSSVGAGETVLGAPAVLVADARRQIAALHRLPEVRNRLRVLEREIEDLRRQLASGDKTGKNVS